MKVIHILEAMGGSDHLWGKERVVQWLMQTQARQGLIQPELITFIPTLLNEVTQAEGLPSRTLSSQHSALPTEALKALIAMLHASPDAVVHTHGYKANITARLARAQGAPMKALVATSHGFDSYARRLALYNTLDCWSAFGSDIVTVTDPRMALRFPAWTKPRYVANALPEAPASTAQQRTQGRTEFGWSEGTYVAGMLHRLIPQKGVDTFITAAEFALRWGRPDIRWVVAGDGPMRPEVEAAAARLTNFQYLGYIDPPENYLAGIDVFVQPSRSEGLSLALLQAMRAAQTVVATRVGATDLTVRDGFEGLLVDPNEPAAIAAAVIRLADDRAHARSLGEAARTRFMHDFRIERQAADFQSLYLEAASRRAQKAQA
jgi:glycosyltransferase involved in cell wall biosynthesis